MQLSGGVGAYPCRQVAGVRDVVGSAWHVWQLASAILFPRSKGGCRHARLQYRIIDTPNSREPAGLQGTAALWRIQNGVVLGDAIRQFAYLHPDGGGARLGGLVFRQVVAGIGNAPVAQLCPLSPEKAGGLQGF